MLLRLYDKKMFFLLLGKTRLKTIQKFEILALLSMFINTIVFDQPGRLLFGSFRPDDDLTIGGVILTRGKIAISFLE